jgi:hypothetical protein
VVLVNLLKYEYCRLDSKNGSLFYEDNITAKALGKSRKPSRVKYENVNDILLETTLMVNFHRCGEVK